MADGDSKIAVDPEDGDLPLYRQIARHIRTGIDRGEWVAGQKLPTQRTLAQRLGVNIATVTKAYALLERQGVALATPGRGTFVRPAEGEPFTPSTGRPPTPGLIDLTVNRAATDAYDEQLARLLPQLSKDRDFAALRDYQPGEGLLRARRAGCRWIGLSGWEVPPEQVALTSGAQHGLLAVLGALLKPGDVVLSEELTYYGLRSLSHLLHFELRPVASDAAGLLPNEVDRAARQAPRAKALFVVPSMHNPTTTTMPAARRKALAAVAHRNKLWLIEDDVYGALHREGPLPLAALLPEAAFYVTGTSKSIAPGLRVGFIAAAAEFMPAISENLRAISWMTSPLNAAVATCWLEDGTSRLLVDAQRQALERRLSLARTALSGFEFRGQPGCPHIWLPLPPPWRAQEFAALAETRGVSVLPAEAFMVGRSSAPHAVRINLGAAHSDEQLAEGLNRLVRVLGARSDDSRAAPG